MELTWSQVFGWRLRRQLLLRDADGTPLEPVPTPETKQPNLASIYALSKFDQERMCLITGRAYGIGARASISDRNAMCEGQLTPKFSCGS